jgi:hypothetical protein
MFERMRTAGLTAAAVFLSLAAPAMAETYHCKTNGGETDTWIAPETLVVHEAGAKDATVNDGIIQHFLKAPVTAKVDTDNAKRTTFSWKVDTRTSTGQLTTMVYRLTIMKADLSASYVAVPQRYSNNFTARGKCERVKG